MAIYGDFYRHEGLLLDISEEELEEIQDRVTESVKEGIVNDGDNPDNYVFETITRQSYNDALKLQIMDESTSDTDIPFVTIAIKATPKKV